MNIYIYLIFFFNNKTNQNGHILNSSSLKNKNKKNQPPTPRGPPTDQHSKGSRFS